MKWQDTVIDMGNPQIMPEIYYPQQDLLRKQAKESFRAGIKEVVDWIIKKNKFHRFGFEDGTILIYAEDWENKLKEWGIE